MLLGKRIKLGTSISIKQITSLRLLIQRPRNGFPNISHAICLILSRRDPPRRRIYHNGRKTRLLLHDGASLAREDATSSLECLGATFLFPEILVEDSSSSSG
ncbi:unnamed protein product [Prunus armeniaca]